MLHGPGRIAAITFDCWNTLVVAHDSEAAIVADAWASALDGTGHAVERSTIVDLVDRQWDRVIEGWRRCRPCPTPAQQVDDFLASLVPAAGERARAAVATAVAQVAVEASLTPNLEVLLDELADEGVRIGVISDVGLVPSSAVRSLLGRLGLLDRFDTLQFSDDIGEYKPARAMFDRAREEFGLDPTSCAHVGDLVRTDIRGAWQANWLPIQYVGVRADPPTGQPPAEVYSDHAELVGVLRRLERQ